MSPKMRAVIAAGAAADGLDNVDVIEMDAENLRFADETFDAVTDVCALVFSPEPERAVREIRRVLKPHGRFRIVVWDEFVGQWITLLPLVVTPRAWPWIAAAFVLFRFFDVVKPWPASWADRSVKGGFGAMLDDVIAGAYAAVVMALLLCFF